MPIESGTESAGREELSPVTPEVIVEAAVDTISEVENNRFHFLPTLDSEDEKPTHIPAVPRMDPFDEPMPNGATLNPNYTPTISSFRKRPASMMSTSRSPMMKRAVSYQASIGGQSIRSHGSSSGIDRSIPPPSSAEEKSKFTRRYMAIVLALCYTLFLIVFGSIVFVTDAIDNNARYPLAEVFGLFMVSIGLVYFICLYIDIKLHVARTHRATEELERRQLAYEEMMASTATQFNNGPLALNPNAPQKNVSHDWEFPKMDPIPHHYCFVRGRHGEFIYLKLGATWFCFGLLIHSVLLLSYQGILLNSTDGKWSVCASKISIALEVIFIVYSLFLVFFFWKYANVVINHYRGIARFGMLHAIGTALAFWIYTIVRETEVAIRIKQSSKDGAKDENDMQNFAMMICPGPEDLNAILTYFSPYLYPFVIEFNILIVGLLYMIFANINRCPKKLSAKGHKGLGSHGSQKSFHGSQKSIHVDDDSVCSESQDILADHDTEVKGKMIIYGDCHASSRGLFAGLLLIVATMVVIILFHIASRKDDYREVGILIDSIFRITVLAVMIAAVILAYFQTIKLDINQHPISRLDDILLLIAVPAFFSETIFSMFPAVENGSILNGFIVIAQPVQMLIQTPWIIDTLRRCSNTLELRKEKPGKELVTFLTIANVSLWIYYTFSVKTGDFGDERYKYYGDELWSILNHLSLPLIMFYRFHSSVCLVDIWRHTYEPGEFAH